MGKRSFFLSYKKKKKRDDFLLPKSSLFFLKPWMNEQKISRILFDHPLKICEQYGFIQSCSYKSKASNRPWTIKIRKTRFQLVSNKEKRHWNFPMSFFLIPSSNRGGSPTKNNITLTNTSTNVMTSVKQSRLFLSLFIISNTPSQKLAKLT